MSLEDITLNQISQHKRSNCMIPPYQVPRIVKFIEPEVEWWLPEAGEGE
jgi:hypothetical protein